MTLNQMPEVVLNRIMEKLDFRSILSLRKTCHILRNFVDDTTPASSISEIYIRINTKKISLKIVDPNLDSTDKSIEIQYKNHKKGCSTVQNRAMEKKKKRLGIEDFVDYFWRDFEIILKHQKSILDCFSLVLEHYEYKFLEKKDQILAQFSMPIMERIKENFTSRIAPLKVKMIDFGIIEQSEVFSILPFIDSKSLEKISIGNSKGLGIASLKIDEIVNLSQWKLAKDVKINEFYVLEPIKSFGHFSKVEISMKVMSAETVRFLREIFHQNPSMAHFEVYYEPSRTPQDLRTLFGHRFDGSYQDDNGGSRWIFRIPKNPEDVISIRTNMHSWLCFDRVKLAEISI